MTFDQIPAEMLDATTAIEDKDFWTNPGFDPVGIVARGLDTLSGTAARRARRSPSSSSARGSSRRRPSRASVYDRKIREIIQSIRLTEAYPGDAGKQKIIAAYLNQNFYGNQSYGVAGGRPGLLRQAAQGARHSPQFAILAAIPQSPTQYDLVRNAEEAAWTPRHRRPTPPRTARRPRTQVPLTSEIVLRRNYILDLMKTRAAR